MSALSRTIRLGDNLSGLRELAPESVALAYLDPPFNSGRSYEAVLGTRHETASAFADRWSWSDEVEAALRILPESISTETSELLESLVKTLGRNNLTAYLTMMSARLGAVHKVLNPRGSVYVHCDPAASHYLKVLLDHLFGPGNFRNEIVWQRTHAHSSSRRYGPVHDVLLFYSKSKDYLWNQVFAPYSVDYIEKYFTRQDGRGKYQAITCTAPGDREGTRAHYRWRGKFPPPGRHWAWTIEKMIELETQGLITHSSNGTPAVEEVHRRWRRRQGSGHLD